MDAYFQEKAPPEAKKRHKTFAAKRSWIKASRLHSERGTVFIPTARYIIRFNNIQDAGCKLSRDTQYSDSEYTLSFSLPTGAAVTFFGVGGG